MTPITSIEMMIIIIDFIKKNHLDKSDPKQEEKVKEK